MVPVLSERISRLKPSPVREILAAAAGREIISLAGGLPAEEAMPTPTVMPEGWKQYSRTEGEDRLRQRISEHLEARGVHCPASRVLITNGSQQGLDLAAKLLVDPGTSVLCESPTYISALQVFGLFGAQFDGISIGHAGPDPEWIGQHVSKTQARVAYLIPSFQNPTGALWSDEARDAFAQAVDARNGEGDSLVLVEDDPYGEIGFGVTPPRPICARLKRSPWILLGSFSKSYLPGIRLGWLACSEELFPFLERLKQAADLHSSRLSQALALADLEDPNRPQRLDALRSRYREKRDAFADSLHRHFPDARWTAPDGGLFFWAHLAPGLDLRPIAPRAMAEGVAFLPGEHCFASDPELGWARLNFSHASPERADEGLRRLAGVIQLSSAVRTR
ncbi:MAG TPA: PLP-dependent aminotransferase family protein [Holophaga sp.]|nr:PLP-dependent aminotransferase family protein [Holophaga sp.]